MSVQTSFHWPNGAQCAVSVTVDFDGESVEQSEFPNQPLWGRNSFGRYGAQLGVYRLLEVLERYRTRATFYIPGWDAERYPEAMEQIVAAQHEVAGHGYAHEDFSQLSPDEQARTLERSEATFVRVFGHGPAGWRAPNGLMSEGTRALLAERGYRYDSSYCDDDYPYLAPDAVGHRLVELPVFSGSGDRMYYERRRSPEVVAAAWQEEFDAIYGVGGLFALCIHPRGDYGSGRGVRIRAVETILQTIRERPRVWVATCDEIANWLLESSS